MNKSKFMVILMVLILMSHNVVYARESVDSIIYITENQIEVSTICNSANEVADAEILVYTSNDGLLSFSNKNFSELPMNTRREFMEVALLTTKESGLSGQVKSKVYNFIAEQDSTSSAAVKLLRSDASTDFVSAAKYFKPFGSIAGFLLGLLSLFIFLFLGLSIVVDCAYLTLPLFKIILKEEKHRPKFISREAYSAAKESEDSIGGEYKNSMPLYFRRRIPTIILMSIALGYLISSQIYDVIAFFIDSFSWIFK